MFFDLLFWIWKCRQTFISKFFPIFFGPFRAFFGGVHVQKHFLDHLMWTINFGFLSTGQFFGFYSATYRDLLHFLGPSGLVLGLGSGLNLVLAVQHYLLLLIWLSLGRVFTFFGHFGTICWTFGCIFTVGVRFDNNFETYKCRVSSFVLEVQPYLFVFNSATFGAFFAFFEALSGDFWG